MMERGQRKRAKWKRMIRQKEKKGKHKRDLQSVPLTSEGWKEEEGIKERNRVFFFLAARVRWQIVNDICKTEGSGDIKRTQRTDWHRRDHHGGQAHSATVWWARCCTQLSAGGWVKVALWSIRLRKKTTIFSVEQDPYYCRLQISVSHS